MKYLLNILWLSLLVATGCSSGPVDDLPETASGNVELSFALSASGVMNLSRTDTQNHTEVTGEYKAFEENIDINDLALLVFARYNDGVERLLTKITDFTAADSEQVEILGSAGEYIVHLSLSRQEMKDFLGFDLTPNPGGTMTFRMLLVANFFRGVDTDARRAKWDEVTGADFATVIQQLSSWSYPMDMIHDAAAGSTAMDIYGSVAKGIPMYGTQTFTAGESDLYYSRPENPVYIGQVDMLRSLAKVRVVDNIRLQTEDYPVIRSVSITCSRSDAMLLPAEAVNYQNGFQVHSPNIYDPEKALTMTDAPVFRLGCIPEQWSMTPAANRTGDTFIGFIPEQQIGYVNNNVGGQGMPEFNIDIAYELLDDGSEVMRTYSIPMTGYDGQAFDSFGTVILRNHIYSLRVNMVGESVKFDVDVVPYVGCNLDPWFGIERD